MLEDSIGYICPDKLSKEEIPEISNGLKKTRGLIIDLRYYPSQDFVDFIFKYILPNSTIKVAQYTYPLLTLPGVFVVGNQTYRVSDNDKYNAPIVVLVNEGNQSAAETSVQVIQCNPNTQTIGSQSAGANGNISIFTLPRGVLGAFSGLGWYYPDGTPVQRQGVKIDNEVKSTIEGVKQGRDEVLETAIRNINERKENRN